MAFVTKQIWVPVESQAGKQQPSGSVIPNIPDAQTISIQSQSLQFDIVASASAAATELATFDDLLGTELVTAVDTHIQSVMGVDIAGNTVDYNFKTTDINRDEQLLNDATANYVVKGQLTIQIS